jgi:3',5'-cyclic AMP phosphodiesterase CpdA
MKKVYLFVIAAMCGTCPVVAQSSSFTFIHLSDLHVSTVTSAVNLCDLNGAKAQCYLHTFNTMSPKPAFILCTGDISNIGNSTAVPGGMYSALTQYLYPRGLSYPGVGALFIDSAQTIPFYCAPGNHEYYTSLTSISFTTETLPLLDSIPNYVQNIAPDTDYAVTTPISVILFMRSGYDISYLISTDPKGSGFTGAQIAWMRNELGLNSGKRKIIVMHHPAANFEGTTCSFATHNAVTNDSSSTFYYNRLAFLDLCDSFHVDVVLCGHQHQHVVVDRHGNQVAENCTTCGTRYVQTAPAFAGCYRMITVDSSFVTVSVPQQTCFGVGVDNVANDLELSVYPDPSRGIFNVNIGQVLPVKINIYNVLGECIYRQSGNDSNFQIDLQARSAGMYFLQLIVDQGTSEPLNLKYPLVLSK